MGTKVTSEWELSSHYNNIIDNNSDKRRDNVLSPFSFILLNNKWQILINQPKWKEKTNDALQVSIDELKKHRPCEAMLMMDYSISGNYPGIYDPAEDIVRKANSRSKSFYEDETKARRSLCKEMLNTIHNLAPESISPNIPSIEECRIVDQKAMISCSEDFRLWVEGNLSVFRPILYKWTMGCALNYLRK